MAFVFRPFVFLASKEFFFILTLRLTDERYSRNV